VRRRQHRRPRGIRECAQRRAGGCRLAWVLKA
jgi:hypothetical protein